jgi:hypothetical protein
MCYIERNNVSLSLPTCEHEKEDWTTKAEDKTRIRAAETRFRRRTVKCTRMDYSKKKTH